MTGNGFALTRLWPSTSSQAPCSSAAVGEGPYFQHLAAVCKWIFFNWMQNLQA
jgi:hypothetical protein